MVHDIQDLRQAHQVVLVLERPVTPPALAVRDERRPAHRGEHQTVAADDHVVVGVARVQGEPRRRPPDLLLHELGGEEDPLLRVIHPEPRPAEQIERPRVLEDHSVLAQDLEGRPVHLLFRLGRQDVQGLQRVLESAHRRFPGAAASRGMQDDRLFG